MCRILVAFAGLLLASAGYCAEPKEELVTRSYDVSDLLDRRSGKSGHDSIDEITQFLVENVNSNAWLLNPDGGNRLFVVNAARLEIKASKKDHDEIGDLLEALRRLQDVAVEVKATFHSVDAKWFDKEIRPNLGEKLPSSIEEKWLAEQRKKAEIVQTAKVRLGNGRNGVLAALHQSFAYIKPEPGNNGKPVYGVERVGVEYRLKSIVSADRRIIRMEMDEIARLQQEPKKHNLTPTVKEKTTSSAMKVEDGEPLLFVSPYTPPSLKDKGRILIVIVEPAIYIEAEEKERRGKKGDG